MNDEREKQRIQVTTGEPEKPDITIWASYVLGHHIGLLRVLQSDVWHHHLAVLEGRIPIPQGDPVEADELVEAIAVIVDAGYCDAKQAMRLARSAERWKQAYRQMLEELEPLHSKPTELDWESSVPPGFADWTELYRTSRMALERDPLLESWRAFGEWLWEREHSAARADMDLCDRLQKLNENGEFPFIDSIIKELKSFNESGMSAGIETPLLDEFLNAITFQRTERYLRDQLKRGAKPEIWLKMDGEDVEFLGQQIHDLAPAEVGILRLLAETPRRAVARNIIIDKVGLKSKAKNLAPHVSRLRGKLRKAIEIKFPGFLKLPEEAEKGFILDYGDGNDNDGRRSYQLEIDKMRVLVQGPRPASMKDNPGRDPK